MRTELKRVEEFAVKHAPRMLFAITRSGGGEAPKVSNLIFSYIEDRLTRGRIISVLSRADIVNLARVDKKSRTLCGTAFSVGHN